MSVIEGSRLRFVYLARSIVVVKRNVSPSQKYHTGVSCGPPCARFRPTIAVLVLESSARTFSGVMGSRSSLPRACSLAPDPFQWFSLGGVPLHSQTLPHRGTFSVHVLRIQLGHAKPLDGRFIATDVID